MKLPECSKCGHKLTKVELINTCGLTWSKGNGYTIDDEIYDTEYHCPQCSKDVFEEIHEGIKWML